MQLPRKQNSISRNDQQYGVSFCVHNPGPFPFLAQLIRATSLPLDIAKSHRVATDPRVKTSECRTVPERKFSLLARLPTIAQEQSVCMARGAETRIPGYELPPTCRLGTRICGCLPTAVRWHAGLQSALAMILVLHFLFENYPSFAHGYNDDRLCQRLLGRERNFPVHKWTCSATDYAWRMPKQLDHAKRCLRSAIS